MNPVIPAYSGPSPVAVALWAGVGYLLGGANGAIVGAVANVILAPIAYTIIAGSIGGSQLPQMGSPVIR